MSVKCAATIMEEFAVPTVINQNLLRNLIIDQEPKGEHERLFLEDGIKWEEVKQIQLEFLNILHIDYLQILENLVKLTLSNNIIEKIENLDSLLHLKELDLSFNRISVIENLNHLIKVEILLLYNNEISVIENIENLQQLTIFNIGNNKITDWEHVLYLRKFKKLRSLNTVGNPCARETGYLEYLVAFIPQLLYYQYKMITDEERLSAVNKYYRRIAGLEETEAKEDEEINRKKEHDKKMALHTSAYIEYLDEYYLFDQMFENDKAGKDLLLINEDMQNAFQEYRTCFSAICNELYDIGLKEYKKRNDEIILFQDESKKVRIAAQEQGRKIANEVVEKKQSLFASMKTLLSKIMNEVEDKAKVENLIQDAQEFTDEFNNTTTTASTNLMSIEVILHDQLEEMNEVFRINMTDMVDQFLDPVRACFSQLRNAEAEYNDTVNGLALYYLSAFGDEAKVPAHLSEVCGDKDILTNNLASSHDLHLQVIDAREDGVLSRIKGWLDEMTSQLAVEETERNRRQILEISHFIETQVEELDTQKFMQEMNLNISDPDVLLALEN